MTTLADTTRTPAFDDSNNGSVSVSVSVNADHSGSARYMNNSHPTFLPSIASVGDGQSQHSQSQSQSQQFVMDDEEIVYHDLDAEAAAGAGSTAGASNSSANHNHAFSRRSSKASSSANGNNNGNALSSLSSAVVLPVPASGAPAAAAAANNSPSRTVTAGTSMDQGDNDNNINDKKEMERTMAAAIAANNARRAQSQSTRELPLPDDTYANANVYDDTFHKQQLVTIDSSPHAQQPNENPYDRRMRCLVVGIVTLCLLTFALTIGIFFGLRKREARVVGGAAQENIESIIVDDDKCCSRDGFTCASEYANFCTSQGQCNGVCEGQWITPTNTTAPPPSGCCSLDGGFSCESEVDTFTLNSSAPASDSATQSAISETQSIFLSICNLDSQSCETDPTCFGGTWMAYCCSTDSEFCNTNNVPECNVGATAANTCLDSCQGTFGPFAVEPPPLSEGCCSYDGGVVCGSISLDGSASSNTGYYGEAAAAALLTTTINDDPSYCDVSAATCHSVSCGGGMYKPTRKDGCCSRDVGVTCDAHDDTGVRQSNSNNNNRLPDFCELNKSSCETRCGGIFKMPPLPVPAPEPADAPTPAPTPSPLPVEVTTPAMSRMDQLKELLSSSTTSGSGVSSGDPSVLERDTVTGLAMTPQAKALDWLLNADALTANIFLDRNGNLSSDGAGANARVGVDNAASLLSNYSNNFNSTISTRFVLATLFFATTSLPSQTWINSQGWLTSTDHCTWYGVTCQPLSSTLTPSFRPILALSLGRNALTGPALQAELFTGLGAHLVDLDLRDNSISGNFGDGEALMQMQQLEVLSLYNNSIGGTLPAALGSLGKLKKLYLEQNKLTGTLPTEIGNLLELQRMDLYGNKLVGAIPASIGQLTTNLQRLWLSRNNLNNAIPNEIGNCGSLQELYLDDNLLESTLPATLAQLTELRDFRAYNNRMTGTLPSGGVFESMAKLQILYLDNNNFSGNVPSNFPSSLRELSLFNNTLTGAIPSFTSPMADLQVLALSLNKLSGPIPSELMSNVLLPNLRILHLYNNSLSGELPPLQNNNGALQLQLRDFFVQHNSLEGSVPPWIYNVSGSVNLSFNNLSGSLPAVPAIESSSYTYGLRGLQVQGNPLMLTNGQNNNIPSSVCSSLLEQLETFVVSCDPNGASQLQASCVTDCVV
jgi:Leucine-rich repeat (LRR) protein